MTSYTITIEGHESGLTAEAIESIMDDTFPGASSITVEPDDE